MKSIETPVTWGKRSKSRALGGTITNAFNAVGRGASDAIADYEPPKLTKYDLGWRRTKNELQPVEVQSRFFGGLLGGPKSEPSFSPLGSLFSFGKKAMDVLNTPVSQDQFTKFKSDLTGKKHGGKVQKKFFGGLMKRAGDFWDSLTSSSHIPKSFRNQMDKHKDEPIESIVMFRTPLDRLTTFVADAITAGNFAEIKQKAGMDKLYHTGIIINGKYQIEKMESPSFKNAKPILSDSDTETYNIDLKGKSMTIGEFIEAGAKKMGGTDFAGYSALKNNCQYFVKSLLEASGLLTAPAKAWVYQDLEKLVEETPSFSKYIMDAVTDTARKVGNAYDTLVNRKGGRIGHRLC